MIPDVSRKPTSFALLLLTALLGAALFAGPASAKRCANLPLSVKLSSHDPTDLLESGQAWVYVRKKGRVKGAEVLVERGNRVFARGRISGRLAGGRTTVVRLKTVRAIRQGRYRVSVTARKGGCHVRRAKHRKWRFRTPSLAVKALPVSTRVDDNVDQVRFALRPIRRVQVGLVRATLVNRNGATVAETVVPDLDGNQVIADLPINGKLAPGKYQVRLVGQEKASGAWRNSADTYRFVRGGGGAAPVESTGLQLQKVVVDWSEGEWKGRQVGGFIAPGIGYGEVVCSPDQQWIRFFPSNGGRESAMMSWTHKDWGTFGEYSLREAKFVNDSGPDFREGLNKFGPTEKNSTGSFEGIISDRGPILGPGGSSLAPPTTFEMSWKWNFARTRTSRCHVEATFRTETGQVEKPVARSAQIVWRDAANATADNAADSVEFPGLGQVEVVCEAGVGGSHQISVDNPAGGLILIREGSDETQVRQNDGPLSSRLPNNGMLLYRLDSGQNVLVSSRWKANDPDPAANWCVVSAQVFDR
ncbi:MAG: hypothetical protein KDB62_05275 [Solirubrobacterales bacterium]|nr:hypothetical protein [Solirubrobacterales bacterium]